MEKQEAINLMKLWRASVEMNGADSEHLNAFDMAIEALSEPSRQGQRDGLISRQNAIDAINGIIDRFERILRDIRESNRDESVCGMCEYDGAYMGQSGDWCNECPGFEKDDCFKLSEECKKRWLDSVNLPSAEQWTLCNKRMPDEREWLGTKQFGTTISDEVYVTFENPKGERFAKHLSFQNGKLSASDQQTIDVFYKGSKPIAWRPFPEPYKGEKE